MLREFFSFELGTQLRQPLLWVCALLFGALAFGATTTDAIQVGGSIGNVNRNAPLVVAQLLGVFSLMSMFVVTIFIAGTVLRDSEVGIADMLFATPMKKRDYLVGRFAAGLVACLFIFAVIVLGMMLGPQMPWVDVQRVGPFAGRAYLWGLGVLVVPNLFFIGALLMLLASTTRSIMLVYVGVLAFFVLWIVAGKFTQNIDNEWVAVLADPFGIRALARATRYFSTAEANAGLPDIAGYMLANRAVWATVALALFGLTLALFKPQRAGTGKRLFGKAKALAPAAPVPVHIALPRIEPRFTGATRWLQCWHIFTFDAAAVFRSVPFLVMLLFGVLNMVGAASQMGKLFGTDVYPMTHLMIELMNGSFNFMLVIIVTFYAGELIFKERQAKIADVTDAMPAPNWAPLLAKSLALAGVVLAFLFTGVLAAMAIQLLKGGAPLEPLVYLKGALISGLPFILMGLTAVVLQVVTNNKFIGYLLMILLMVWQVVAGVMHLDHNLVNIDGLPRTPYSDMNGYGHFIAGWAWFALYWTLFTVGALIVAQAFWVRGLSVDWRARVREAGRRLRGPAGVALALCALAFAGVGGWIFHNTNTLAHYEAADVAMDKRAQYEKTYRQYKDQPLPKITDVRAAVDIYPEERRVAIKGSYVLENKTAQPLDTLRLQLNPDIETTLSGLPAHKVELDDKKLGVKVLKLAQALPPGGRLPLDFTVDVRRPGFRNNGESDTINLNGTFFNNHAFFPLIGYQPDQELTDRNERRKRGLGEPERMAKLEDQAARANTMFGADADWINFETVVSTSGNQIALAPGYLQKSWKENGRNYYQYKMDQKMMPFFAYLSADWQVKKGDWHGIPIEIYHDRKHGYNVDRMIERHAEIAGLLHDPVHALPVQAGADPGVPELRQLRPVVRQHDPVLGVDRLHRRPARQGEHRLRVLRDGPRNGAPVVGPPDRRRQRAGLDHADRIAGAVLGADGHGEGIRPAPDAPLPALRAGSLPELARRRGHRGTALVPRGEPAVHPLPQGQPDLLSPARRDRRSGAEPRAQALPGRQGLPGSAVHHVEGAARVHPRRNARRQAGTHHGHVREDRLLR
jgi:ABC-2 type transport system permease protein